MKKSLSKNSPAGLFLESSEEFFEFFVVFEGDGDGFGGDFDFFGAEFFGEGLFAVVVERGFDDGGGGGFFGFLGLEVIFDFFDGPTFFDEAGEEFLDFCFGERDEGAHDGLGKVVFGHGFFGEVGEFEETEGVFNGRFVFADASADVFGGEVELRLKFGVGGGKFEGVQIFALSVFDDGDFEAVLGV